GLSFHVGWVQNRPPGSLDPIHNPLGVSAATQILDVATMAGFALLGVAALLGIVVLVLRYRQGSSDERHQLKMLLYVAAFVPLGFLLYPITSSEGPVTPVTLGALALASIGVLGIPVAMGVAILKYRLYDIDVVISRTLVYGTLAAFITLVYVGIVVGVGTLVGSGGKPNLVLSIVATAVVAVAFQAVREWLQRVANRLVYGRRATPYEVLSEFSSRVAEGYAAEQVLPRMARVLAEGTGAERAVVWLRAGSQLKAAAVWPTGSDQSLHPPLESVGQLAPVVPGADRAVPVRHQGELLGVLAVAKRAGESLTPIEEKLLEDLARQAGLVLKNVGLTADLQARLDDLRASRQRLVQAQDSERRRLERNLHDGAQQNLVAIKVKLGLAEMLAGKDPGKATALVAGLKADTDEALATLRDLARGIYPPLLADRGLVLALEAQARKATVPVSVEADGVGRYSQETEAAVYFCILEALQNVQKYAGAREATVRLRDRTDSLHFEIEDDGAGFDPAVVARGTGLQNMEDRLDALGGRLEVASIPGSGTTLSARIPIGGVAAQ
ncbi:MAG: histidine kinase, partial [Candidatus Dormibacteraeota bacterium]|nr:histidine kinase [Candidatus Dormibacteraeota bacterium]